MKVVVEKDELQRKLSEIQNIVEKRSASFGSSTMPILNHFLLTVDPVKKSLSNGADMEGAFITATDLETAFRGPVKLRATEEGKICIPARKLFEIVKEMEGDITLESVNSQWVKVKSGNSHFRLACLPAEEFPAWPSLEDAYEMNISPVLLVELINRSIYAAGETDTKYVLNGLLFHIKPGGKMSVVGTDGHRLALSNLSIGFYIEEEKKLIISRKSVVELRRHLQGCSKIVGMSIGKNMILFKVDNIQFLVRLIEGTYPNYEAVMPTANEKIIVADRGLMTRSFRRVSIMSKERSSAVKVDIASSDNGGSMVTSASNPELGEASDEIGVEYLGDPMTITFNARYVLDALSAIASERVILKLNKPLDPVLIMEEGNEDYRCVLMPMRS